MHLKALSRLVHSPVISVMGHHSLNTVISVIVQCLLLVEVGLMPKAAEGEVAFRVNILNKT